MPVDLSSFDNGWYRPGRSFFWQAAWFFLGLPVLRSSIVPFSGMRIRLLRAFGAKIGHGVVIKPGVRVKYPWRLTVGKSCWIGEDAWIDNLAPVTLGDNVCVSQGAYLCTGSHDWNDPSFGLIVKPILLHSGCRIAARSLILPGVTVETGGIAAAGSVVSKSISAFEIHSGNPAAFTKMRSVAERYAAHC